MRNIKVTEVKKQTHMLHFHKQHQRSHLAISGQQLHRH